MHKTIFSLIFLMTGVLFSSPISQKLYVGPEIYSVRRVRAGGSWQTGVLYGGRFGWERIQCASLYGCLTAVYAGGTLRGKSGSGSTLYSHFTDFEGEARIGYTFMKRKGRCCYFIPFIGLGCVSDTNHFVPPSPLTLQFHDFIKYVSFGFLADMRVLPCFDVGLTLILKSMFKGTCNTSGDAGAENTSLRMTNKLQYEVDLPLTWAISKRKEIFTLSLVPFYEFRHYGGRENFPYDFLATKFYIYGGRLLLNYQY